MVIQVQKFCNEERMECYRKEKNNTWKSAPIQTSSNVFSEQITALNH